MTLEVVAAGRPRTVEVRRGSGGLKVAVDGRERAATLVPAGHWWSLIVGGRSYEVSVVDHRRGELTVFVNGRAVPVVVGSAGHRPGQVEPETRHAGPERVVAPMPGRIVKLLVEVGDIVAARQGLIVVEAMKMENELRAPRAGTVTEVRVAEGASVDANAVLVVIE